MTDPVILTPDDFPAQDYIELNGDRSPGKATIRGLAARRDWDIRKGTGLDGATIVPQGVQVAEFSVLIELWEAAQITQWYAFATKHLSASVIYLPGAKAPRAMGIGHPILFAPPFYICFVVLKEVTQLEQDDEGLWSCSISFIQFRPPIPQKASAPKSGIPAAAAPQPTAEDAADREMAYKQVIFDNLVRSDVGG